MTFYNQSLLAVKEGRKLLEALNVPTKRPNDFFCENVKTDSHMNRVRSNCDALWINSEYFTQHDIMSCFDAVLKSSM